MNYQELRDYALQCSLEHHLCNVEQLLNDGETIATIMNLVENGREAVDIYEPYEFYEIHSIAGKILYNKVIQHPVTGKAEIGAGVTAGDFVTLGSQPGKYLFRVGRRLGAAQRHEADCRRLGFTSRHAGSYFFSAFSSGFT